MRSPWVAVLGLSVLLLPGCVASGVQEAAQLRERNRANLTKLSIGMSKDEVIALMGTDSVDVHDLYGGVNVTNPYRIERLKSPTDEFEVLYYFTQVKVADRVISDDELTPLVFSNGKLMGWGHRFLEKIIQDNGIMVP